MTKARDLGDFISDGTIAETVTADGLNLGDNEKIQLGASQDLQIYHDGSHSYIDEQGTGSLQIRGTNLNLKSSTNETYLYCVENGEVGLQYDNSLKLATSATGATVTGTIAVSDSFNATSGTFTVQSNGTNILNLTSTVMSPQTDGAISLGSATNGFNNMYLDGSAYVSGNVGIGTTSPSQKLHVEGAGNQFIFLNNSTTNDGFYFKAGAGASSIQTNSGSHVMNFFTGGAERMRINASGSLLVGKTSTAFGTDGTHINNSGYLEVTNTSGELLYLNRLSNDGDLIRLFKDSAQVGSIGTVDGDIYVGTGDTGLFFSDANNEIRPYNTSTQNSVDAAIDLGRSASRFKDLYLSGSAFVGDKIIHDGDTDTYIGFTSNNINFRAANVEMTYNDYGLFLKDGSVREDYDALSGTSPTCNVNNGGAFSLSMSGNTTFSFTSPASGYSTGFILQLTGNGSTVTWPASVDWAGGTAPDAPASGETDLLVFWTRDGGTTWYGMLAMDAAA